MAIRAPEVRLLDERGSMIGVMPLSQALAEAKTRGVDLVEVSPKAVPPVCKVIDYGKMLYAEKKKEQQAKKHNKPHEVKGIRLTFRIGPGDMERQRLHAEEFLKSGHPVRIQLMMRGREKAHRDLAFEKLNGFIAGLKDFGALDQAPRGMGHQLVAMLRPEKKTVDPPTAPKQPAKPAEKTVKKSEPKS